MQEAIAHSRHGGTPAREGGTLNQLVAHPQDRRLRANQVRGRPLTTDSVLSLSPLVHTV